MNFLVVNSSTLDFMHENADIFSMKAAIIIQV